MQIALFPKIFPTKIRPLDRNEHPRDRMHKRGALALSDAELLASWMMLLNLIRRMVR